MVVDHMRGDKTHFTWKWCVSFSFHVVWCLMHLIKRKHAFLRSMFLSSCDPYGLNTLLIRNPEGIHFLRRPAITAIFIVLRIQTDYCPANNLSSPLWVILCFRVLLLFNPWNGENMGVIGRNYLFTFNWAWEDSSCVSFMSLNPLILIINTLVSLFCLSFSLTDSMGR